MRFGEFRISKVRVIRENERRMKYLLWLLILGVLLSN